MDGASSSDEYIAGYWFAPNHTAHLEATRPGVRLAAATDGTLFLHVELPDELGVWFMSGGELDLLIDGDQINTSMGFGCGALGSSPGPHARRIVLSLDEAAAVPSVTTVQQIGTCLVGDGENWRDVTAEETWAMTAAIGADEEDGTVTLELSVLPVRPSGVEVTAPVGIQLNVDATLPGIGVESILRLPWKPNRALSWRNAATWQPVFFRTGQLVPST